MIDKLKNMDKKMLIMLGFLVFIIFIIIIIMIIMSMSGSGKMTYQRAEKEMVSAAKRYYKDNKSSLPQNEGEEAKVDTDTLISNDYLVDFSGDLGEDCSGTVLVGKTKNDYDYVADLTCGDKYSTNFLYRKLLENVVSSGNGLYKVEDLITTDNNLTFDESGYDLSKNELMSGYIFRGNDVNNYISFGTKTLYRIVKIDGNNDIMVIPVRNNLTSYFDNSFNTETNQRDGINDYSMSKAKKALDDFYNGLESENILRVKSVPKHICIGTRSEDDTTRDGSSECSKVLAGQYYSLIPVYDYMNASLDTECVEPLNPSCTNYNYMTVNSSSFWTMTASSDDSYSAFLITGKPKLEKVSRSAKLNYAIYLTNRLLYVSGTGTQKDPFVVK